MREMSGNRIEINCPLDDVFNDPPPDVAVAGDSPDGGDFVLFNGRYYWNDGDVTDVVGRHRLTPGPIPANKQFHLWSNNRRIAVKKVWERRRRRWRDERAAWDRRVTVVAELAMKKLTTDEIEAILEYHR